MDYLQESTADEAVLYFNGAQLNGIEIAVSRIDPNKINTQESMVKKPRPSENSLEHKKVVDTDGRKQILNKDRNGADRGRDKKPIVSNHGRDRTSSWRHKEEVFLFLGNGLIGKAG
jgi:hypothetical protein